jgi:hypothetical protein
MEIAIKGDKSRGKDVLQFLELLGGKNSRGLYADTEYCAYYIGEDEQIGWFNCGDLIGEVNGYYVITLDDIEKLKRDSLLYDVFREQ